MKRILIMLLAVLYFAVGNNLYAQKNKPLPARTQLVDWYFQKDSLAQVPADLKGSDWKAVQIPHSWNTHDVMDDKPGYYRNKGWYKLDLGTVVPLKGKLIRLHFDGANQETSLYVNGKKVGDHVGGYTAFNFEIQDYLDFNGTHNEVVVCVNNRFNLDIPPLTADFTFFGGIYREVFLDIKDKTHFSDKVYGSTGVYYRTPIVNEQEAKLEVFGQIGSSLGKKQALRLVSTLFDADNKKVTAVAKQLNINQLDSFQVAFPTLKSPKLWSPDQPYLYQLVTQLLDSKGQVLDEQKTTVGFRYFRFDAKEGFFLNGKSYKLIGASRHQDFKDLGNAVPYAIQVADVYKLKAMGGNFLRVAHYPQNPAIMEACDRLGILTSVEIPLVNAITETKAFETNSLHMQEEMIRQNYNHSSVIIWAHMNEILLRPLFNNDKPRQEIYFKAIYDLASKLDVLTRKLDPHRYTMLAHHGAVDMYERVGLTRIAMINGWNLYPGWYGGVIADFGKQLDDIHRKMPNIPMLVTEYGADADPRIHSFSPVRFDKSVEYAVLYNQGYMDDMLKRPFVAGGFAWNLADFNSETRAESMPHINNKGLLTWDRQPKNTFHLYEAYLVKTPYVKLGTALWKKRGGIAPGNDTFVKQPLEVYSNQAAITLYHNGQSLGTQPVKQHNVIFDVPFVAGANVFKAVALDSQGKEVVQQQDTIAFQLVNESFDKAFTQDSVLHFSLGENRYVLDDNNELWLPLQVDEQRTWGVRGGEDFRLTVRGGANLGTDRNITNTFNDPVYQTQQVGIKDIFIPLPEGSYRVVLHFAELSGGKEKEVVPYDLENPQSASTKFQHRLFNVYVNHSLWLNDFDLSKVAGVQNAHTESVDIITYKKQGLKLAFEKVEGEPVLNAISIYKLNK